MDKAVLLARLTSPRQHVLGVVEGLDDDQLRRAVLPSGWTPMQLLHHLAVDVERFWFRGPGAGVTTGGDASSLAQRACVPPDVRRLNPSARSDRGPRPFDNAISRRVRPSDRTRAQAGACRERRLGS